MCMGNKKTSIFKVSICIIEVVENNLRKEKVDLKNVITIILAKLFLRQRLEGLLSKFEGNAVLP